MNGQIKYNFEAEGFIFSTIYKPYPFTDYLKIIIFGFGITSCYLFVNIGSLVTNFLIIFIVVPCMLFQSLFYCSNSCTSLHFKH
jgi:hypothetical protein